VFQLLIVWLLPLLGEFLLLLFDLGQPGIEFVFQDVLVLEVKLLLLKLLLSLYGGLVLLNLGLKPLLLEAASSARSIVLGFPVISSSGVSRSEAEASSGAVAPLVDANAAGFEVEASFSSKAIHSPRYEDNSDEYGAPSSEGSRTVSGGCRRASPALFLIADLTGVAAVEEGSKEEFVYSKACGARDCAHFPVRIMQRELLHVDWDCELGKLHVSIFPYFSGADTDNLCFTDNWARAICFWDSPSIEFVKDYLSIVCSDFDLPEDVGWWRFKLVHLYLLYN
jgi:hypothetical protein